MKTKFVSRLSAGVLCGGILLTSVFAMPVQAQTLREQVNNRVDQYIENRCDRVTARVEERIDLYNKNKEAHIKRYQNITDNVTNLITKLKSKGYDTTAVAQNLQTFDGMVKEAAGMYTSFIQTLDSSKAYACGNSEGQFEATIEQSLTQLREFRAKTKDIISFVRETLRPSIQDLRKQKPANSN